MNNSHAQEFAEFCIKNNITALDSPAKCEKAKLIAKQTGISDYSNLSVLQGYIDKYIASEKAKSLAEKEKQIKAIKEKENEEKAQLEKHGELHGRDKPIAYCDDYIKAAQGIISKYNNARQAAKTIKDTYAALGDSVEPIKSPSKQDWAIAGGIASAIAGPAAGIAVAADIQHKNAQSEIDTSKAKEESARARESFHKLGEILSKQVLSNSSVSYDDYSEAQITINHFNSLKDKYKISLVDDTVDPHRLLNTLNPQIKSITKSESGTVKVVVSIEGGVYSIYEGVDAVIDGSFGILLWNKSGMCCGFAIVVLPMEGAYSNLELEALITMPKRTDVSYWAEITVPDLWLIETDRIDAEKRAVSSDNRSSQASDVYYIAFWLLSTQKIENVKRARELFMKLGNWRDAPMRAELCSVIIHQNEEAQKRIEEAKRRKQEQEQREIQLSKQKEKKNRIKVITISASIILLIAGIIIISSIVNSRNKEIIRTEVSTMIKNHINDVFTSREGEIYGINGITFEIADINITGLKGYSYKVVFRCVANKASSATDRSLVAYAVKNKLKLGDNYFYTSNGLYAIARDERTFADRIDVYVNNILTHKAGID